jgi:hypothetical protein
MGKNKDTSWPPLHVRDLPPETKATPEVMKFGTLKLALLKAAEKAKK